MRANEHKINELIGKPFAFSFRDTRFARYKLPSWKQKLFRSKEKVKPVNPEIKDGWQD